MAWIDDPKLTELFEQRKAVDAQINERFSEHAAMDVQDYELTSREGEKVKLSALFGEHDKLLLIHNMGRSCAYCTLWADGFIGIAQHFGSGFYGTKTAFVLVNHDSPEEQRKYAEERGWEFPMACATDTTLSDDLGFLGEWEGKEMLMPGVSALVKEADGSIRRHGMSYFGPGDNFCSLFHFFNLLPAEEKQEAAG